MKMGRSLIVIVLAAAMVGAVPGISIGADKELHTFLGGNPSNLNINDQGTVVCTFYQSPQTAVRFDSLTNTLTVLGGLSGSGETMTVYDINNAGTAVGSVYNSATGRNRAVTWNAAGTAAELPNQGILGGSARAINDAGMIAGSVDYLDDYMSRSAPVRWDASGSITSITMQPGWSGSARKISETGTIMGIMTQGVEGSAFKWSISGTTAYTDFVHSGGMNARDINDSDIVVGSWFDQTLTPIRWTDSLAPLDMLGDSQRSSHCEAINNAGVIAGTSDLNVNGSSKGSRAVRWGASGTSATELPNLGTDASGFTFCNGYDIDDGGYIVGRAKKYVNGSDCGYHAVYWDPAGNIVDLNDLIDPNGSYSGWTLTGASAITNTGWIVGRGQWDPDGSGPMPAQSGGFTMQIPEPASLVLISAGAAALLRRRQGVQRVARGMPVNGCMRAMRR